jgi:hypothetical protein
MAKLVDALPSGGSVRKNVQVRILFWALIFKAKFLLRFFYTYLKGMFKINNINKNHLYLNCVFIFNLPDVKKLMDIQVE